MPVLQALQENVGFRSLYAAVCTLLNTVLGDFDFHGWVEADRILAPIMFFCYNLLVLFIMLSVFVAILNISVNSVRQRILEQINDFEVLDYMMKRFRLWLGLKSKVGFHISLCNITTKCIHTTFLYGARQWKKEN
jgi:hypothetical protein